LKIHTRLERRERKHSVNQQSLCFIMHSTYMYVDNPHQAAANNPKKIYLICRLEECHILYIKYNHLSISTALIKIVYNRVE